jgi:hypothetical protein
MALYNPNAEAGYATTRGKKLSGDDSGGSYEGGPTGQIQLPNGQIADSSIFENDARLLDEKGNTYQSIGDGVNPKYVKGLASLQQGPNGNWYLNEDDFKTFGTRLPKETGALSKMGAGILALPIGGFFAAGGAAALGAAGAGAEGATAGSAGGVVGSEAPLMDFAGGLAEDAGMGANQYAASQIAGGAAESGMAAAPAGAGATASAAGGAVKGAAGGGNIFTDHPLLTTLGATALLSGGGSKPTTQTTPTAASSGPSVTGDFSQMNVGVSPKASATLKDLQGNNVFGNDGKLNTSGIFFNR